MAAGTQGHASPPRAGSSPRHLSKQRSSKQARSWSGGTWAAAAVVALLALGVGLFFVQQQQQRAGAPAAATGSSSKTSSSSSGAESPADGTKSSKQKKKQCDPDDKECLEQAIKAKRRRARGVSEEEATARRQRAADRVQADLASEHEVVVGSKTYHPSFGIFPKACKWRTIADSSNNGVDYEFWQPDKGGWVPELPPECSPTGFNATEAPPGWDFHNGTPRSEVSCDNDACNYHNFYYNNGRWYALVDGDATIPTWRFSRNQEVYPLHYTDVRKWLNSVKWRVIPGDSLMFDFVFYTHPTAIGHWWEMLGPMYSTLKKAKIKRPVDQFVLLHLQRQHMLEWVRAMIAVTLGSPVDGELPSIYMQHPVTDGDNRLSSMIEGFDKDTWYIFERMALTKDLYTGGGRTFLNHQDSQEFRELVYEHYGLPPPKPHKPVPKLITFQRKRANRRIINEEEVVELLQRYGTLEIVEYNSTSSLYQQLLQMRRTGVYVSVHTSNLANAPLLQGGSAVIEMLHRNWHWNGLDTSFRDQTYMMGDIHHYAWRARFLNQTVYINPRDLAKIGHWPASECGSEECVEAHTRVDLVVDVKELKALLDDRLPHVFAGKAVRNAYIAWPPTPDIQEDMYRLTDDGKLVMPAAHPDAAIANEPLTV